MKQYKNGKTEAGSQRYRCCLCGHNYSPQKKEHGYGVEVRRKAIRQYVDGMNLRRVGRQLGLHHRTVANWVKEYSEKLPNAPVPERVKTAELDELFTFIGEKKNRIYIVTVVDRETRCILGWNLLWDHCGRYAVSDGKSDTHSVEADNAEMRHYLARLARSLRCFSRCPYALYCAMRLFVYCYNQRQLKSRQYPAYPFHLIDFIHTPT